MWGPSNFFGPPCISPWLGPPLEGLRSYVLPVLWITSCFHINGPYGAIDGSRASAQSDSQGSDREQSVMSTISFRFRRDIQWSRRSLQPSWNKPATGLEVTLMPICCEFVWCNNILRCRQFNKYVVGHRNSTHVNKRQQNISSLSLCYTAHCNNQAAFLRYTQDK